MQLETKQIAVNNKNRWIVVVDGIPETGIGYGTIRLAFERMDALWLKRTQSDKTMEALYVGHD